MVKRIVYLLTALAIIASPFMASYNALAATKKDTYPSGQEDFYAANGIRFYTDCPPGAGGRSTSVSGATSGSQVTWIGDSYSDGFESGIDKKFPGIDFGPEHDGNPYNYHYYTRYSKHIRADGGDTTGQEGGITILKQIVAEGKLRDHLVFELGGNVDSTHDSAENAKAAVEEILSLTGTTHVVFVTAWMHPDSGFNSYFKYVNDAYREAASKYTNVSVADWEAVAKGHESEYFDATNENTRSHPNNKGHGVWEDLIIETLKGGSSGGTSSSHASIANTVDIENATVESFTNYAGEPVFVQYQIDNLKKFAPLYKKVSQEYNLPWALIAITHILESGQADTNPSNGQGLFQAYSNMNNPQRVPYYTATGKLSEENMLQQMRWAYDDMISAHPELKDAGTNLDADLVKDIFFAYNGKAAVYINKALAMGFTQEEANHGEGSAYVMNRFDERRDPASPNMDPNWPGRFVADGVYDPSSTSMGFGGYVQYAALAGVSSNASTEECCDMDAHKSGSRGSFHHYEFNDTQLYDLLDVANGENGGSDTAIQTEMSIMANLYEKNGASGGNYTEEGMLNYIRNGGWFAEGNAKKIGDGTHDNHSVERLNMARDIYNNGNRTLPVQILEHDCIVCGNQRDIIYTANNGVEFEATDRSQYKRGVTLIKNRYGSTYIFWDWADPENKTGDPFGYFQDNPPSEVPSGNTQSTSVVCPDASGPGGEEIAASAIKMAWPIMEGADQGKCKETDGSMITYNFSTATCFHNPRDAYRTGHDSYGFLGIYEDCGQFVGTVLYDVFKDDELKNKENAEGPPGIDAYLSSHPNEWEKVNNTGSEDNLRPGDIFVNKDHAAIYVGEKGGDYKMAQASYDTRVGTLTTYIADSVSGGKFLSHSGAEFHIYRRIGGNGGLVDGGFTSLADAEEFMKAYHDEAIKQPRGSGTYLGAYVNDAGCPFGALSNCVAFSQWFINKYTTYNYQSTVNGVNVVSDLLSESSDFIDGGHTPRPYAIFSYPIAGNAAGHTGVVLGVNQATDTIIIGEASCSSQRTQSEGPYYWPHAVEKSLSERSSSTYSYAYTDNILKKGGL